MAFVMGVYAFGAYGVLVGPLVAGNDDDDDDDDNIWIVWFDLGFLGALLALIDIYKKYLNDVNHCSKLKFCFL